MAYRYLTFGHHGREVPIAETVCQVPADALLDEMRTVATATIDGVAGSGFGHFGLAKGPDHRDLRLMHQNLDYPLPRGCLNAPFC